MASGAFGLASGAYITIARRLANPCDSTPHGSQERITITLAPTGESLSAWVRCRG